jgi:hypothetical protein
MFIAYLETNNTVRERESRICLLFDGNFNRCLCRIHFFSWFSILFFSNL